MPPDPNVASGAPEGSRRATYGSLSEKPTLAPASTIRPCTSTATPQKPLNVSASGKVNVALPRVPNEVSSAPAGVSQATYAGSPRGPTSRTDPSG